MEANGEMGPTHLMVPLLNPPALLSYKCLKNISLYIFCVRMLRVEGVAHWLGGDGGGGGGYVANGSAKIHRQCCLPLRPDNYQVVVATYPCPGCH